MHRKTIIKLSIVFALSFFLSLFLQKVFNIDLNTLRGWVLYFGPLAPIVYTITLTLGLTVPLNPVSDFLVVSLAALLFPPLVSVISTFAAHLLALTINYWVARAWADDVLRKVLNKDEAKYIENLSKKINLPWIFGLRFLLPLTAIGIDGVSYAAGLAKLPFNRFLLVSIIPWTFFNISYFYSTSFLRNINPALILVPALVLAGVPILIISFRKRESLGKKLKKAFPFKKKRPIWKYWP